MRRLVLVLAVAAGSLIAVPAVLADSPLFATTDGSSGVVHGTTRYVLIHFAGNTTLVATSTTGGTEPRLLALNGNWYFPNTPGGTEGVSHDGKTLLLVDVTDKTQFRQTTFLVVDPLRMKRGRSLKPYASTCPPDSSCGRSGTAFLLTDGLSPDASRLYAVEYSGVDSGLASPCFLEYGIDLGTQQSVSMRTDDRLESLEGTAEARAWSADGRWAYTLYRKPSGTSFIQALDTVGAAVHCISLPKSRGVDAGLALSRDDRILAVSRSGGPSLDVAVRSWRISQHHADAFPWVWLAAGIGGLALISAAGGSVLRRRRGEKVE